MSSSSKMSSGQEIRQKHVAEKVLKYETFLNERLKPDLKAILEERDGIYTETAEFLALRNSILAIRSADLAPGEPLKTKVDLGCNFYCNAEVVDPSKIFVEIGLGFFVEFTLDEAEKFVDKKVKTLESKSKELSEQASKIKANIRLLLEGLRELQNIDAENKTKNRYDPMSYKMEIVSLEKSVSAYFSALSDSLPNIEAFEKEASLLIDKLVDHVSQAIICQRVHPSFLQLSECVRIKAQLLNKIYSKCFVLVEQLKFLRIKFQHEIVSPLSRLCIKINRLMESMSTDEAISTSTVDHIPLKDLVKRIFEIDILLKLQSERMRSAILKLSTVEKVKSDLNESQLSANNIETIFLTFKENSKNVESYKTVGSIIKNYRINEFPDFVDSEVDDSSPSEVIGKLLTNAFVTRPGDKKTIEFYISQTTSLRQSLTAPPNQNTMSTPKSSRRPSNSSNEVWINISTTPSTTPRGFPAKTSTPASTPKDFSAKMSTPSSAKSSKKNKK